MKELSWALLVVLIFGGGAWYYYSNDMKNDQNTMDESTNIQTGDMAAAPANLVSEDTVLGTGAVAEAGKMVTVHYVGTLTNGTKFDSSRDRGEPFVFTLGVGQVIKGWDQGVAGMKVGGKRKLTIPPDLGYGSQDMGTIPPNSTLVFEVELLGVK